MHGCPWGGACQAPAGGVWAPVGGGMGALKHFCREGRSPKKPRHNKKKDPPHREKSSRKALTW